MSRDEPLTGGVANAGAVVRRGDLVVRPATAYSAATQRFLQRLRDAGFGGLPEPHGIDGGYELLGFVDGEVPVPPYPEWAQSDLALTSIVALLKRFHEAARTIDADGDWNPDLADPVGGSIVCHNDVCPENVVFRDGVAVALLDWEFAAPGRPLHDLAQLARMCVPLDDAESAARLGWNSVDAPRRARLVCDTYGLSAADRAELLVEFDAALARHTALVARRVAQGDRGFVAMWDAAGGVARFDRRDAWWLRSRPAFEAALR